MSLSPTNQSSVASIGFIASAARNSETRTPVLTPEAIARRAAAIAAAKRSMNASLDVAQPHLASSLKVVIPLAAGVAGTGSVAGLTVLAGACPSISAPALAAIPFVVAGVKDLVDNREEAAKASAEVSIAVAKIAIEVFAWPQ